MVEYITKCLGERFNIKYKFSMITVNAKKSTLQRARIHNTILIKRGCYKTKENETLITGIKITNRKHS